MSEAIKIKFLSKNNPYTKILLISSNLFLNTVILVLAIYIKPIVFENWLFPFTILSLIQLFINLLTITKLEKSFLSLTNLFLIFSYITHLGILVIFGFDIEVELPWNPLLSLTKDSYKEACYFAVFCHAFLTFGMCIILFKRKTYKISAATSSIKNKDIQLYLIRSIGIMLIIIGIIPMLYIDISRVILYITGDYLDTYKVGVGGFMIIISRFTEIGAIMLLIGNHENKKKAIFIILIIVIYQSIIMFTGNRGRPIMFLITIFFIYYNFIKKVGFKQFINTTILIYIVGFLLTFIGQIRMLSINDIGTFVETFKKSFFEFSIFKILAEFGSTIVSLGFSLELFPEARSFQLGTNYLVSLLTIFPNLGGILTPVMEKAVFVYNWPQSTRSFLGGSYLGELYYSFGDFSFVFVILIGMFIAFVSNKIKMYIAQQNYVLLSVYLILFPSLLWWTRDYFVSMVREFVWIAVVILILYYLIGSKLPKSKGRGEN
ncbi:O-antigen polysaccharide polymerase Wzy [Peribacillus frigoritolerans]|uniref:O-antigen polysaccharide polymerase Wzy n=1 Tax=Peribacillus frigoritolerans TaxID=450367 RepID=UPI002B2504ED|nr:O-antigen polysaccharide polymerase Wzy [Peribacillus frigoritolerans]MEB2492994.1 O-antigen polysaccharide polymerase Wzy [Peribacillus frigoritolerans]